MKVKFSNFEGNHIYKYNDEFASLMTRKCKCGHSVTIYNRHRREICSNCERFVFASTWLPTMVESLSSFSLINLFINFLYGKIDITSTVLFVTLTILCILITIIIMQRRKSVK